MKIRLHCGCFRILLRVSEFNKLHSTRPKLPTISTTMHNFVQRREIFNPTVRTQVEFIEPSLFFYFIQNSNSFTFSILFHLLYSICSEANLETRREKL